MAAWQSKCGHGITKHHKTLKGALIAFVCATGAAQAACEQGAVDLRWDGGSVRFNVEIADTFEDRARGLMFRESLPRYGGMLFIYEKPLSVSFWMKNTLIPLDMIFLDRHGVVQNIHENAVPGSLETIPGGDDILAVLEVNGGLSTKLGVPVGAEMRHPAFGDSDPIWPCN